MRQINLKLTATMDYPEPPDGLLRVESHRLVGGDSDPLRNPFFDRLGRSSSMTHFAAEDRPEPYEILSKLRLLNRSSLQMLIKNQRLNSSI